MYTKDFKYPILERCISVLKEDIRSLPVTNKCKRSQQVTV